MIIFFVFFISFMVVAINFAKTYRVKNGVIEILERYSNSSSSVAEINSKIDNYLTAVNYVPKNSQTQQTLINERYTCNVSSNINNKYVQGNNGGVCIEYVPSGNDSDIYYYRVTSYMVINTSFFNVGIVIPISGETRTFNDYFN